MAIPRRLALRPLRRRSGIQFTFLLSFANIVILILDVNVKVFEIMIAPAPFALSGLFEVILDCKVTRYGTMSNSDQPLLKEDVEVLTAVLFRNLVSA